MASAKPAAVEAESFWRLYGSRLCRKWWTWVIGVAVAATEVIVAAKAAGWPLSTAVAIAFAGLALIQIPVARDFWRERNEAIAQPGSSAGLLILLDLEIDDLARLRRDVAPLPVNEKGVFVGNDPMTGFKAEGVIRSADALVERVAAELRREAPEWVEEWQLAGRVVTGHPPSYNKIGILAYLDELTALLQRIKDAKR